jgi:hypothetical protein
LAAFTQRSVFLFDIRFQNIITWVNFIDSKQ